MKKSIILIALLLFGGYIVNAQQKGLANPLEELLGLKDTALLNQKIKALYNSNKEEDVTLVMSYYSKINNSAKFEAVLEEILRRFPAGRQAYTVASNAIIRASNAKEKENLYKEMQARFLDIRAILPNRIKDIATREVVYAFITEGDTLKARHYLKQISDKKSLPEVLYGFATGALKNKQNLFAEQLMKEAIAIFDTLQLTPDPQGDPLGMSNNRDKYAGLFYSCYASALITNGKNSDGLLYAKKAYEVDNLNPFVSAMYAQILIDNKI